MIDGLHTVAWETKGQNTTKKSLPSTTLTFQIFLEGGGASRAVNFHDHVIRLNLYES